jgi:hypothetical protein
MRIRNVTVAAAVGALLFAGTGVGHADTFYNDLDLTIDAELEVMNLSYDTATAVGQTGSTVVSMRADGHPLNDIADHPGCNVQGDPQFVTIEATSSDPAVAILDNGPTYTFDQCTDTFSVRVLSTGLGTAVISFEVVGSRTPSDPAITFDTAPADFRVNVTEGTTPPTGCDADPAAPAWAAAILQASGVKAKDKNFSNWISAIALEMTQRAMFDGFEKGDHPSYENAVRDRLLVLTNRNLVTAQQAARPGWTCAPIQ